MSNRLEKRISDDYCFSPLFLLQVTQLKNEVHQLKTQINWMMNEKFLVRGKRQTNNQAAEKSGVPIFDYAYEANLVKGRIARNHLSVYPTLMGEDGDELKPDENSFQPRQNQNSFQNFQDHNQLGILRDDNQLKQQSAYARVKQFLFLCSMQIFPKN